MIRPRNIPIQTKMLLAFIMALLLSVGISGYTGYQTAQSHLTASLLDGLKILNNARAIHISDYLEAIKERVVDFSSDGFIRDAAGTLVAGGDEQVRGALNAHLVTNKLSLDKNMYGINITDLNGIVIASTNETEIGLNESNDAYFLTAKDLPYGSAYLGDVGFGAHDHFQKNQPTLTVSASLTDRNTGKKIGVLIGYLFTDGINRVMTGAWPTPAENAPLFPTRATQESYLVNRRGFIISPAKFTGESPLFLRAAIEPLKECFAQSPANEYLSYAGHPVVGISTCLENGWNVVTELGEYEAYAPIRRAAGNIFAVEMVLAIFATAGIFVVTRALLAPLRELARVAAKVGGGDFSVRAIVYARDEFGALAKIFNQMVASLRDLYFEMDSKIVHRTGALSEKIAELEKTKRAMLNLLEDIDEEKRSSRALAQELEKFKLAVDHASDHIIITNPEGTIIYANAAASATTGYTKKEIIGANPRLWGGQMKREFYEQFWGTIKTKKKPFMGEIVNKRKHGEIYIAELHASPILNEQENILFFVGIERDITRAKEVDRAKSEIISLASHQLRTPLTAVNWYSDLLLNNYGKGLNKTQKELAQEIHASNKRMIELINALLNVSRIDMGTLVLEPRPTDLQEIAVRALEELSPAIEKRGLVVNKEFESKLPMAQVDPKLATMVMQNLLSNAVKYTPENGTITVTLRKKEGQLWGEIADTGCGIPADQQNKVFNKMFRAANARAIDPDGTGLGLYLTKYIVEQSGGKIWFTSQENKGTTFFFTLPIARDEQENSRNAAAHNS